MTDTFYVDDICWQEWHLLKSSNVENQLYWLDHKPKTWSHTGTGKNNKCMHRQVLWLTWQLKSRFMETTLWQKVGERDSTTYAFVECLLNSMLLLQASVLLTAPSKLAQLVGGLNVNTILSQVASLTFMLPLPLYLHWIDSLYSLKSGQQDPTVLQAVHKLQSYRIYCQRCSAVAGKSKWDDPNIF